MGILSNEKIQAVHRTLNTLLAIAVLVLGVMALSPVYDELSGLKAERLIQSEIAQIVADEGYRARPYRDSVGKLTVGFGHLIVAGENFKDMTPDYAVKLLRKDYANAAASVDRLYDWAEGDVRLVLINMTYQLGSTGLSNFKNTISYLREGNYDLAAGEMLNSRWAMQTPNRAARLAGRIMSLK